MPKELNDRIIQARCKSTDLATVAKGLLQNGAVITSTSSLVRDALQWLAQSLVSNGEVDKMSMEEAKDFLVSMEMGKVPTKYKTTKLGGYVGDRTRAGMIQGTDPEKDMTPEQLAEVYKDDPELQAIKEKFGKNNSETS